MGLLDKLRARPDAPTAPDHYDYAARRIDEKRASQTMGDPMPSSLLAPSTKERRNKQLRWTLLIFLGVIVFTLVIKRNPTSQAPTLAANCTKYQIAINPVDLAQGKTSFYTVTGPSSTQFAIMIDVARLVEEPSGLLATVPRPGIPLADTRRSETRPLSGCHVQGFFVADQPPGDHTVSLFDATKAGGPLASTRMTITGS